MGEYDFVRMPFFPVFLRLFGEQGVSICLAGYIGCLKGVVGMV